jgi:AmmeMemoRadiSam system protein B
VRRAAAAAGLYYPSDPSELARTVDTLLDEAGRRPDDGLAAVVAPHAGYEYSGRVAAAAFALVPPAARAVLLGPSHFVALEGLAVSGASTWATPFGDVPVAEDLREAALESGAVVDDAPHARDHALEVELPFLQRTCTEGLEILPVAVGQTRRGAIADLLAAFDALVVVSTDLSHFLHEEAARRADRRTAAAVVQRDPCALGDLSACGVFALRGLLEHARRNDLALEVLDLRTSADAGAERERVVGYGAFAGRRMA